MLQNKTFGSALIIAGTTIGAGMLAMPLTSAGMGFGYTVLLLVGLWALLVYSGLLFVEFINFTLCTFSRLYYWWRISAFRLTNGFWNGSDVA